MCKHVLLVVRLEILTHVKFLVDGVWMHNPKDRTISDSNEANSVSPGSGKINLIEVRRSDYEVFEALDNDTRDGCVTETRQPPINMYISCRLVAFSVLHGPYGVNLGYCILAFLFNPIYYIYLHEVLCCSNERGQRLREVKPRPHNL